MRAPAAVVCVLVTGCTSQVSLGSESDHTTSMDPVDAAAASTTDASAGSTESGAEASSSSTHDVSAHTADAAVDMHAGEAAVPDGGSHYAPCVGKACGVACTVCDPHDTQCVEPPGSKQCNAHEQCVTLPMCP